jgi:hypothetical protein
MIVIVGNEISEILSVKDWRKVENFISHPLGDFGHWNP